MLKTLLKSVRQYLASTILTPIFVTFEVILEILIPKVISNMINVLQNSADVNFSVIGVYGGILFSMAILSLIFGMLSGMFAARASSGFARNLRHDLFAKIQTYSFKNIDKFSVSSLVTRLTVDIFYIKDAYQYVIRIAVRSPIMLICALIMSFTVNSVFSFVFLGLLVFIGIGIFLMLFFALPSFKKAFHRYDLLNNDIQENIKGIRVVKSYVKENYEIGKLSESSKNLAKNFLNAETIMSFAMPMMQFAMYTSMTFICALGSYIIVDSFGLNLNVGQLQELTTYGMQILSSLMMFSMVFVMISMAAECAVRCVEVLKEEPDIANPENPIFEVKDGSISFDKVFFKYSEKAEKYALNDINLTIPSGSTVGIFGATGSSKSSLVNLICRLYDVSEGSVKVGGIDVKDYDLKVLRDQVAVVLQKNVLFKGTIKDNIRWGNENATDKEIVEVCKLAEASEFIEQFKDGYDHMIEQGGSNVSGGQKQRLCIARALLKKPKVLILDDSTSAVDTKTDYKIRQSFKNYIPSTTKIIIGQRISSLQDSDMIIIMNDGMIQQVGTHEELLKTNKIYQEVYNSQNRVGGDGNE